MTGPDPARRDGPVADELAPFFRGAATHRVGAHARAGHGVATEPWFDEGPPAGPAEPVATGRCVVASFAGLADRVRRSPARLGPVRLVAVDGRAGSGKSTFARRLCAAVGARGLTGVVFNTDEILQGWLDTVTFWPRLEEWVLGNLRRGRPARYRRFDWDAGRFRPAWRWLGSPDVLVLEGVSVGRAVVRPELTASVWLQADRQERFRRALRRDGARVTREWRRWMLDEDEHFAADPTMEAADVIVDAQSTLLHDQERQYVRIDPAVEPRREGP